MPKGPRRKSVDKIVESAPQTDEHDPEAARLQTQIIELQRKLFQLGTQSGPASVNSAGSLDSHQSVQESEEHYRSFIETTPDLMQSVDSTGRFIFVHRAWLDMMGYTRQEVDTLHASQVVSPDSLALCKQVFSQVMAGREVTDFGAKFVTKDGRAIFLSGNVTPRCIGGKVVATHGLFRNITEHRRTEERFRWWIEKSADGIVLPRVLRGKVQSGETRL
jgi:PAS domain S-box-containing protein